MGLSQQDLLNLKVSCHEELQNDVKSLRVTLRNLYIDVEVGNSLCRSVGYSDDR